MGSIAIQSALGFIGRAQENKMLKIYLFNKWMARRVNGKSTILSVE